MGLLDIQARIARACVDAGRAKESVKLIAVSKVQPNERVRAVLTQGHRLFGENKLQEAAGKWPAFHESFENLSVHMIGPLQTNKTRAAMALFQAIQTLDRPKLAVTIARIAQETGACPDLMVQVNTGDESQKAGVSLAEADGFIRDCLAMDLPVRGLMCIPPADQDPAPHFAALAAIAAHHGLIELSMGMSSDFEVAIRHGATYVRVGSAIFGDRVPGALSRAIV